MFTAGRVQLALCFVYQLVIETRKKDLEICYCADQERELGAVCEGRDGCFGMRCQSDWLRCQRDWSVLVGPLLAIPWFIKNRDREAKDCFQIPTPSAAVRCTL